MYYLYLLLCEDGSVYTGITPNIDKRFAAHKSGKGAKYTRSHKPVRVLYSEHFRTKNDAAKREAQIKGWRRDKKLELIKRGRSSVG